MILWILIFSSLSIQCFVKYFANAFIVFDHVYLGHFVSRVFLPVLIWVFFFKQPLQSMGFRLPNITKREMSFVAITMVGLGLLWVFAQHPSIHQYYASLSSRLSDEPFSVRAVRFSLFVLSTVTAWEVLHRGFLLFGLNRWFQTSGLHEKSAQLASILIVCVFEVVFHFSKPFLETVGMAIASPLLSLLAFRTRSFIPSLVLHLLIEAVFFFSITR